MFIQYQNLTIRNAEKEDAKILTNWWNDGKVMAHAGFPNGLNTKVEDVEASLLTDTDQTHRRLLILADELPIGEMNYRNKGNGVAEIGIKICDASKQEKGYGKCLLSMFIESLFKDYGYEKIILDTNVKNSRAQHVYEGLGFQKIRVNENSWTNQLGELQSSIDYALTKKDFNSFIK